MFTRLTSYKNLKYIVILFTTVLLVASFSFVGCTNNNSANNNASQQTSTSKNIEENVNGKTIGIAWRSDTDSEFYTNVVEAIKLAGGKPVLLGQVICNDLPYEGTTLAKTCITDDGYITEFTANVIKEKLYEKTNVKEVLGNIDHVIFTGGEDVSPTIVIDSIYPKYLTDDKEFNGTRDVSDYLLMNYCLDNNIKILGICRGMQMLGVCSGAAILQDIPTYYSFWGYPFSYEHRNKDLNEQGYRDYTAHEVDITDNHNLLYDCYQSYQLSQVPSWHHQALLSVEGTHLRKIGKTTTGGYDITEAIQRNDKTYALGIQFHPEASIVKHQNNIANANNYMDEEDALKLFKAFCE